jgi:PrtD family type I secretion system ABC transporter
LTAALVSAVRGEFATSVVLSMFMNILALTLPLYMLQVFNHVLVSRSAATLVLLTLMAVAAIAVWGILSELRTRLLRCAGDKADLLLGERVQKAMIARATQTTETRTASGLRDLATLRNTLGGQQVASVLDVMWTPLFIGVTYLLSPLLGLIALGGVFLLLVIAWLNNRVTREPQRAAGKAADTELAMTLAAVRNAEVVEGMGMRAAVVGRWQQQHLTSLGHLNAALNRGGILTNLTRSARLLLQIVILAAGAYLVIANDITMGAMMASVYLLGRGLAPVDSCIQTWRQISAGRGAYQRIALLVDQETQRPSGLRLPRPAGHLKVQSLVYGRPGLPPVLKGVSFSASPGEILGIVGPSAAGKSTLLKLIVGVWRPHSGTVRLDGAEVGNWDPDELGGYVGYLPQDVELFAGTVHENISRLTKADPSDIIAAAKLAGVHDLILKLPKGYDTEIGESGSGLSGGQKQRIGLARALFGSPSLVALDEPNASLDGAGEEALVNALNRTKERAATVILVTHKPSILFVADKILVLNDGIIESFGARNEVLPRLMPTSKERPLVRARERNERSAEPISSVAEGR